MEIFQVNSLTFIASYECISSFLETIQEEKQKLVHTKTIWSLIKWPGSKSKLGICYVLQIIISCSLKTNLEEKQGLVHTQTHLELDQMAWMNLLDYH